MELRVLRYFLTVAREESISKAAEVLHVTQPTLSRQIMELEEELGKQLLVRGGRRLSLTEEGRLLRRRAEEIVDLVQKTQKEITEEESVLTGTVAIGGGETDGMRLLARVAKDIQKSHPLVHIQLFSGNAENVTERLDKGLIDFGVLIGSADIQKYDFLSLPVRDVWGVLMRKDSPLAAREALTPQDLSSLPLIVSSQALVQNELSGWLGYSFDQLSVVASYNLVYNASLMVQEGCGYALTLDKLVSTGADSPLCFRPLKPQLEAPLMVIWKKYTTFSKAACLFLNRLREVCSEQGRG